MVIGGLIGVNLVLALLAVWAFRLLRTPDPSRTRVPETAATAAHRTEPGALVGRAVTTAEMPAIDGDSLAAMFAFDSRRATADRH